MFKNVIVGVDHREGGRDAIALAVRLLGTNAPLTFAHIYAGDPYVYRGVSAAYEACERRDDLELLTQARADAGVRAELRWHRASSVGGGLHELCVAAHADLLVVGASRRRGMARAIHADDARGALGGAPCAVAIAPSGYRDTQSQLREIGVGYDGTPESSRALHVARELAATYGTELSAFEVIDEPGRPPDATGSNERIQAARIRLARLGGIEPHVAHGRPAEELTLYSRIVDLLVIGSPGRARWGRPGRSGVARELARTARCPLLVISAAPAESCEVRDASSPHRRRRSAPQVPGDPTPDHSEALP